MNSARQSISAQQETHEQGRREQGKARRRRRILDAAAGLVETDGLDGVTMRRLSDAAGVSYATVYNLVGAKEDVLVAVLRAGLEDLGAQLAAVDSPDPLDRARAVVAGVVDHFVARPALYRALVQAVHDPAAGARGLPIRRRTIAVYEASIRDAIDAGLLRDDLDAHVLGVHITLAVNGVIRRWAAGEIDATGFRAEADYALRIALLGVATPSTRTKLLAELCACERTLVRSAGRAA
ncbi:MAG TPA: TetR/AcrR family transcriptional regulator [Acidimicrobiia bacterium]|nr:TetR/AcrR family transcriptional regulator [Acidimicrobiia bacterium]